MEFINKYEEDVCNVNIAKEYGRNQSTIAIIKNKKFVKASTMRSLRLTTWRSWKPYRGCKRDIKTYIDRKVLIYRYELVHKKQYISLFIFFLWHVFCALFNTYIFYLFYFDFMFDFLV